MQEKTLNLLAPALVKHKGKLTNGVLHFGRSKPYIGLEDNLQKSAANYMANSHRFVLFTHVANERKTKVKVNKYGKTYSPRGNALKLMGVKKGFPDCLILKPSKGYSGLLVELKTKGGSLGKDQKQLIIKLNEDGYLAVVCWCLDSFMYVVEIYLNKSSRNRKRVLPIKKIK